MVDKAKRLVIVVSEDKFDKAMMSMMMANTAASMGMEVHVFHTFFGLNLLKKGKVPKLGGMMRLFTGVFVGRMKAVGIENYPAQLAMALDLEVNIYACSTTMALMRITKEDMVDGVKILGAAGFLDIAADGDISLFIG